MSTSHNPATSSHFSASEQSDNPPWMDPTNFPVPPMPFTYGYQNDKVSRHCSCAELMEEIQRDTNKKIPPRMGT